MLLSQATASPAIATIATPIDTDAMMMSIP